MARRPAGKWTRIAALAIAGAALAASRATAGGVACGTSCDVPADCGSMIALPFASAPGEERFWFRGEYLLWQLDGSAVPPLVTASPAGTPLTQAGVLGNPSTQILAGNEALSDDFRSGWGVAMGYWLDPCRTLALVGDYFNAGRDSYGFEAGPDSDLIIARPFFNTETGAQVNQLIDADNELDGLVRVRAYEDFQGAGVGLQRSLWSCSECGRSTNLFLVGGYRYYQHDSLLAIGEDLTVLPGTTSPLVPGTTIVVEDRFSARNEFHGGEIGLQGRMQRAEWWLDGMALVAVGGNRRTVFVDGVTTNSVPGFGSATLGGGVLTSTETNIGRHSDSDAAIIPRFRLGAGCQISDRVAGRIGYNVIIWDEVAQAAAHLPPGLAVDPRNLPPVIPGGGADPAFPGVQTSTVVAHGFDFGLEFSF